MPDRSWERGLQQMIQSKEGLAITAPNESIARISHQDFFGRYLFLAGMSGTLGEVRREIRRTYGLDVVRVPTHRPSLRRDLGMTVCATNAEKRRIIALKVRECMARSQPVLIGTRTVADSELLSAELEACGLAHTLLNAHRDAEEADIIAKAGRAGAVTVATNMAGRGTDIKIEAAARAAGGLHVIASERHDSRRIDRQLFGRAARQGDPGSFEEVVALDDRLTAGMPAWRRSLAARLRLGGWLMRFAQWRATRHGARLRRRLAQYEARMQQTLSFAGSANNVKKVDIN
jgi:preprotein translocase subunit SecA